MLQVKPLLSRAHIRLAVAVAAALLLAACGPTQQRPGVSPKIVQKPVVPPELAQMYGSVDDGEAKVPAVDVSKIDPQYLRQVVDYETDQKPGTIVVDPHARFLYLVMENGKAMRYGVGVGKEGLEFKGAASVSRKASWPGWTPTQDMIKREPERYKPWAKGMDGGVKNPLGARALYLYQGGKDTLYRIHGTNEPESIGQAVSSGCIRLFNQDIIDLHSRVPKGSRVVVL